MCYCVHCLCLNNYVLTKSNSRGLRCGPQVCKLIRFVPSLEIINHKFNSKPTQMALTAAVVVWLWDKKDDRRRVSLTTAPSHVHQQTTSPLNETALGGTYPGNEFVGREPRSVGCH